MEYIEIHESFNIAELQLIKHALEHDNIDFKIWNETLLQTGNVEAMGYSGARVKVNPLQVGSAKEILAKIVFDSSSEEGTEEFLIMQKFAAFTDRIPVLNWVVAPFRIVAIALILTLILFSLLYWFSD